MRTFESMLKVRAHDGGAGVSRGSTGKDFDLVFNLSV
jgi:hypothetical protein